jgi:predicted transcriptional regulator of viral defense system
MTLCLIGIYTYETEQARITMTGKPIAALDTEQLDKLLRDNGRAVLMPSDLNRLLSGFIPRNSRRKDVVAQLEQAGIIRRVTLRSDEYRDLERIAVMSLSPEPNHYALSIRRGSYLSHASAVHLLGLTEQQPRTIYVNKEQTAKPRPDGHLTQEAIDRAFSRPQRSSNYVFRLKNAQAVLLSGKATGNAGVITDQERGLAFTGLERTLIDATVRPRYVGGVFQVMSAFSSAKDELDVGTLLDLLDRLDYVYPYHQAIGFYLERSGAGSDVLDRFRALGIEFDFYLDYSMASPRYDESWRVFYPLGV